MPVRSDPTAARERWVSGMQGATQAMTRGVNGTTVAPGQKAAAAADKWLQRTTNARDKYARRVGSVTLEQWQQAMLKYGIGRVGQGASQKAPKFEAFMVDFLPFLKTGVAKIDAMPKVTLGDSVARAVAMIEYNAGYVRKG